MPSKTALNPASQSKTLRNVAYLRVSTLDQDLEKNKSDIRLARKDWAKLGLSLKRFPGK